MNLNFNGTPEDYLVAATKDDNRIYINENEFYDRIKHLGDGKYNKK